MAVPLRRGGWSLQKEEWKQLAEELAGARGSHVKFVPKQKGLVTEGPGIYVICLSPEAHGSLFLPRLYDAIYVGKAINLQKRFVQHLAGATAVAEMIRAFPNSLDFWFFHAGEADLSRLERLCYDVLGPRSNKILPPMHAALGPPESPNP
jgi:hypothetical protein